MRALEVRAQREGWRSARLGQIESVGACGDADVVVVDRVGVLAELYTVGDIAWVGGGFHGHGLHSVLEPAAAGLPVLFGPRHRNARAAGELLASGAARMVRDVDEAALALAGWLEDADARAASGASGVRYIEAHLGAAGRTAGPANRADPLWIMHAPSRAGRAPVLSPQESGPCRRAATTSPRSRQLS